jgi:cytochrome o ubiquinol oxidase subunit 2
MRDLQKMIELAFKIGRWADTKLKYFATAMTVAGAAVLLYVVAHIHGIAILEPKGPIARQEFHLLVLSTVIMLFVVIPVFVLTVVISIRYRATNKEAKYLPDWDRDNRLESLWWGIPCAIIAALAVLAWTSSHTLDPYRPLSSSKPQMAVQVVAMDWKWLFIYPAQHIATVNYVEFPSGTPVAFQITSDAPMNSFWIPQLGGQIYAMAGMSTQLHLMADHPGTFNGLSANISGVGFAGMTFKAKSVSQGNFNNWVTQVQKSPNHLTALSYRNLSKPSQNNPVEYFATGDNSLYDNIVMKYMTNLPSTQSNLNGQDTPMTASSGASTMSGMDMQ